MTKIVETENYTLSLGKPVESNGYPEVYQVINKKYGVVEVESTMLPQAIKFIYDLEAGLAAITDMYCNKDKANVVPLPTHTSRPRVN